MPAFAAVTQQSESANSAQSAILSQSVQKGDTLIRMLKSAGVKPENATAAARALTKLFDPRKLRIGQRMMLHFGSEDGERSHLSVFSIELGKNRHVEVTRGADGKYRARRSNQPWSPGNTAAEQRNNGLITLKARSGDTIGNMMRALNIHERDIDRAVKALRTRYDPRNLRVGQKISILPGTFDAKRRLALLGVVVHLEKGVVEVIRGAKHSYSARRLSAMTLGDENSAVAVLETTPQALAGERQKLRIPRGATLMKMLTARGVSRSQADRAIRALKTNFDPRRLRAGNHIYVIVTEGDGGKKLLQGLSIAISNKRHVTVMRGETGKFTSGLAREPINSLASIAPAAKTSAATPASSAPQEKLVELPEVMEVAPKKPVHKAPQTADSTPAAAGSSAINAVAIRVNRGDTLMAILRSEGIDRHEADRAIRSLRKLFNPRRLRENQQIVVATTTDGAGATLLNGFSIKIRDGRHIEVRRASGKKFAAAKVSEPNFVERAVAVNSNEAGDAAGPERENINLAPQPGQGQAMRGAMIAAAAPAEQDLVARAATAWPAENEARKSAGDNAENALEFPTSQEKQAVEDGLFRKAVMIGKGDTLFVALTKAGSAAGDAEAAIAAFRKVHNPRSLQIGQTLTLAFEPLVAEDKADAFRLAEIALDVAPDRDILVARQSDDSFQASEVARDLVRRLEKAEGHIQTSLYDAATKAGLPINILMEMVQIFSFDVDFQREIQKDDHFEVLYENLLNDKGETVALGPVLFASLSLSGNVIGLYRHEPSNGPVDYFNIKGQSARKALMRTPINGARLSSGYGMRRHPVLGYNKMHRGLDFSAPRGTPIVAAGDGVIEVAGRNGAYGNYIRIRHNGTYKTAYAHMKGFARGMRAGKRVRQGQTIGYVGSTGRSTGPHLHYEVLKGSRQMNPRKLKLPTGQKLKGAELALFQGQVRKVRVLIAEVPSVQKVASR